MSGTRLWLPGIDLVVRSAPGCVGEQKNYLLASWKNSASQSRATRGRHDFLAIDRAVRACGGPAQMSPAALAVTVDWCAAVRQSAKGLDFVEEAHRGGVRVREDSLWLVFKSLSEVKGASRGDRIRRVVGLLEECGFIDGNPSAYNRLIATFHKIGDTAAASKWEAAMAAAGVAPDTGTLEARLAQRGYANALNILRALAAKKARPTESILCKVLASTRNGSASDVKNAQALFDALPRVGVKRTLRMYDALLSVYASVRDMDGCLRVYGDLLQLTPTPDYRCDLYLLTCCTAHAAAPGDKHERMARVIFERAAARGVVSASLCTHLAKVYAKTRNAAAARQLRDVYIEDVGRKPTPAFEAAYEAAVGGGVVQCNPPVGQS